MSANTFTTTVNGQSVTCHPNLQGFTILKKESSNVDYFATYRGPGSTGHLFMQFLTGKCYVYNEVPTEVLDLAVDSDSIGKFYYKFIKGKYLEEQVDDHCIVPVKESHMIMDDDDFDDEDDLLDDRDSFGSPYGGFGGDDFKD